jgi:alpha-galactosidase
MLVIGLKNSGYIKGGGCTDEEYRTQMSMWCMFSAPLMIGCNISAMSDDTKAILLNKDIIAIDQDPLGKQAFRVWRKDGLEAWHKPLSGGKVAIALLNRNSFNKSITIGWKDLELDPKMIYEAYDVWKHEKIRQAPGVLTSDLKSHECQVFVLTKI